MNLESNEISVIADEYVLGLLEDGDRAYVEAEIELNAALKQAVAEAYERFLPLDTGLAPTDVSPSLWNAISSRLTEQQRTSLAIAANPAKAVNDNHRLASGRRIGDRCLDRFGYRPDMEHNATGRAPCCGGAYE